VIRHLDGREVVVEEEGITQPGWTKVMEGEGMPLASSSDKGNLYVKINVLIPDFNEQQLDELEQFFSRHRQ
jgi:DnaJ-class molecular chaperone